MEKTFIRKKLFDKLWQGLRGNSSLIQVVTGPRQVGKTTLALQVFDRWQGKKVFETADQINIPDREWLVLQWEKARKLAKAGTKNVLLILDEVQKISRWSEVIKKLIDEDKRSGIRLRTILLGSSALLVQRGLAESLAGRFELHRHPHWSYEECHECFGLNLEEYLIFGGYPGGLPLRHDFVRWSRYIRDSLIETVIGKDVLLMSPVQKPALLRQVFGMACMHPAEILSYQKMIGQLTDAGNTVTIAHYFNLLSAAHLLSPLPRWSGSRLRQRGSIPKIVLRDNSLATAISPNILKDGKIDPAWRGRLVENAVGALLITSAEQEGGELFYWRDRQDEVDYVLRIGQRLIGIEVKSGQRSENLKGLSIFRRRYPKAEVAAVGSADKIQDIHFISLVDLFNEPSKLYSNKS